MKTKVFAFLAAATLILNGGPALAHGGGGHRGGGGHGGGHHGGGGHEVAFHGGGGHHSFGGGGGHSFKGEGGATRNRTGIAFGGSTYGRGGSRGSGNWYGGGYRHGYGGWGGGWYGRGYPFGWDYLYPGYDYYPDYGYGYTEPYYGGAYSNTGSTATQVQQDLSQMGYYHGPVDGVVGPITQSAISAYQHDHGMAVTGTIDPELLQSLGI